MFHKPHKRHVHTAPLVKEFIAGLRPGYNFGVDFVVAAIAGKHGAEMVPDRRSIITHLKKLGCTKEGHGHWATPVAPATCDPRPATSSPTTEAQ